MSKGGSEQGSDSEKDEKGSVKDFKEQVMAEVDANADALDDLYSGSEALESLSTGSDPNDPEWKEEEADRAVVKQDEIEAAKEFAGLNNDDISALLQYRTPEKKTGVDELYSPMSIEWGNEGNEGNEGSERSERSERGESTDAEEDEMMVDFPEGDSMLHKKDLTPNQRR